MINIYIKIITIIIIDDKNYNNISTDNNNCYDNKVIINEDKKD